jgi:membrane associated rhomboid family serine protease
MPDEQRDDRTARQTRPRSRHLQALGRGLFLLAIAVIAAILGFLTGSHYGDTFAPGYRLLGLEGYLATRLIGALTGGAAAGALTALMMIVARRRTRVALFASIGILVGLLLTEPLLFALLPPHHGLLPAAYLGAGLVGCIVGALLGRLSSRRPRRTATRDEPDEGNYRAVSG